MSRRHPIVAVTGSSGAGTTAVKVAFEAIFHRLGIHAAVVEGDSFHRYDRAAMQEIVREASAKGRRVTHFGPSGNEFDALEMLFRSYGDSGRGDRRFYVHTEEEAGLHGCPPGSFTAWEPLPGDSDLLFYEGLHGGLRTPEVDVVQYVDLLVGVVPIINLEWIQKIHRDRAVRGYSQEDATLMILQRMHDYVHYIVPQFTRTDINFQRVPMVDTSNPFAAEDIPGNAESWVVIHVRRMDRIQPDFDYMLKTLQGAFMSRPDTLVIPATRQAEAMEFLIAPVMSRLMEERERVVETPEEP